MYLRSKKISCRACLLFYLFFLFGDIKILFQSSFNLYFIPWLLNSFDLPSCNLDSRKRYTLRLFITSWFVTVMAQYSVIEFIIGQHLPAWIAFYAKLLPKLAWNSRAVVVNILEMVYSIKSFCKVNKYNSCKELVVWSLQICYLKAIWINLKLRTETRLVVMQNVVLKHIEQYHLFLLFKKAL